MAAGVTLPKGFTVTVEAYRQHCAKSGLDRALDAALGGLRPDTPEQEVAAAARAAQAEVTGRDLDPALAVPIGEAYEELSSRCFDISVPTAVRSSAIGEDSGTASFAGIFDTFLGVSGRDRVLAAVETAGPACSAHAPWRTGSARARITRTCRWRSA